jgi:type IV pilus assembly protein PilB
MDASLVQNVTRFLNRTVVFTSCPAEVLETLSRRAQLESFEQGAELVDCALPVDVLSFLAQGRAKMSVIDHESGEELAIAELSPGDSFGETAMTLGVASDFRVIATMPCVVLRLQRADVQRVARAVPDVSDSLSKRIAAEARKTTGLLRQSSRPPSMMPPAPMTPLPPFRPTDTRISTPPPDQQVIFVQAAQYAISPKVLGLIPARIILEHRMLPLALRDQHITVGMVDPFSVGARGELSRALAHVAITVVAISTDDFVQTVRRLKLDVRAEAKSRTASSPSLQPVYNAELKREADKAGRVVGDEVVKIFDDLIRDAIEVGASDIHIDPEAKETRVRMRIQGMMVDSKRTVPPTMAAPLAARIKVLAELDITERRQPQDGRILAQLGDKELNLRVATLATARGEKIAIRLLDPADVMRPLNHIFLHPKALELVRRAVSATYGSMLVAGATGSGKTSTMYSVLNERKHLRPDNNIVTVEDPIEFLVAGLSQYPVAVKAGLGYPTVLRAMLRQDPDVIMIGELRDAESATIMVEAALTGHFVLATVHGSHVGAVLNRMTHFGVDEVLQAQAINIVLVQRLARRLCSACVALDEVAPQLVSALAHRRLVPAGTGSLPRAIGCDACGGTGYRGRVAVVEVMHFSDAVRGLLAARAPIGSLLQEAAVTGDFVPFSACAALLLSSRVLTPADALALTD